MTTKREHAEARAERRRTWAESQRAKADALEARDKPLWDDWAFVTQPGHIPERERAIKRVLKGGEHRAMANHHDERAANIDRQLERTIFSDDDDAAERLAERIAELEAERDRIKAYNASCRKGAPDTSLLDDSQRADLASCMQFQPYACKAGAFPGYVLSNLGSELRRYRARLEALEGKV